MRPQMTSLIAVVEIAFAVVDVSFSSISQPASTWQLAEQQSPFVVLPSSQVSVLLLTVLSPQTSRTHTAVQPSPLVVLPSSQVSVPST